MRCWDHVQDQKRNPNNTKREKRDSVIMKSVIEFPSGMIPQWDNHKVGWLLG